MSKALRIQHDLADVVVKPTGKVNSVRLRKMIRSTLDQYLTEDQVSAKTVHDEAQRRHGDQYQTPGYYLRLYRQRSDLTQATLATKTGIRQHHVSEMENNKRGIGKSNARKIAKILDCDYRKFL